MSEDEQSVSEDEQSVSEEEKLKPILDFLERNDTISPKEARDLTGKSAATVRRYLTLLCERGVLESVGNTSAVTYKKR